MILVDTSVWIEVFRSRRPLDLQAVVDFDDIATCLPVIQEVLQGLRDEAAFRRAREAMFSLPIVESPLAEDVFSQAVDLYRGGGLIVPTSGEIDLLGDPPSACRGPSTPSTSP